MSNTLDLIKEDNILKKFEEIQNIIYANDGLSTQEVLDEMIKILFIKFYDETNKSGLFKISNQEFSKIQNGQNILEFTERVNDLFVRTQQNFQNLFEDNEKIRLSPISLANIILKLQNIDFQNSTDDAKGLAFQKFLNRQDKGDRGQFFTPEPIINFCVDIIQPKPEDKIIDPACGSGGFLFSNYLYILKHYPDIDKAKYVENKIYGLDINKRIAKIAEMKFLLDSNSLPKINCVNGLLEFDELKNHFNNENFANNFDLVLANPPFGTAGKISQTNVLSKFDLGHRWMQPKDDTKFYKTKQLQNAQVPDILFIERCLQFLKEGGRMGIVLPNGHFENPSLEYLRYYIKSKARILAVVNLPQETFVPFGTGIKASLLFLQKETLLDKNKNIFFGQVNKLGYQGNKNGTPIYKKDLNGQYIRDNQSNNIIDEDFTKVVEDYKIFEEKNEILTNNSYTIPYSSLNGRLDYDFYSPKTRFLLNDLQNKKAVKLADICEIVKIKSSKLSNSTEYVEYIELSDINTNSFEIINSTNFQVRDLPSRASYELKENDIITAIAGNSVGTRKHATALVTSEFVGSICTNGFRVLRNFKIDFYYLLYYFQSELFLNQMFMYRTGAAIPNVNDIDLKNILIHLPDDKKINEISQRVRKSFEYRKLAKLEIETIEI